MSKLFVGLLALLFGAGEAQKALQRGSTWANLAWENVDKTSRGASLVFVDMDTKSITTFKTSGQKFVCYISAGTVENWRQDAKLLRSYVSSSSRYSGESWLDITRWRSFSHIMNARMTRAKSLGCDAIEPDNVDCHSNKCVRGVSAASLRSYQVQYLQWLAATAHSKGMKIGLKNSVDLIPDLVSQFDFAVSEGCTLYNDCRRYEAFTSRNKAVYGVEYSAGSKACTEARRYGITMTYRAGGTYRDC